MLRYPLIPYVAFLEVLPFFLQFLGLGLSDRLGQGLCGSVFGVGEAEAVKYGLVSEYYSYGQFFLALLALKVTYALGSFSCGSCTKKTTLPLLRGWSSA